MDKLNEDERCIDEVAVTPEQESLNRMSQHATANLPYFLYHVVAPKLYAELYPAPPFDGEQRQTLDRFRTKFCQHLGIIPKQVGHMTELAIQGKHPIFNLGGSKWPVYR